MDNILDQEVKEFLNRLEDKVNIALKRKQIQVTEFIDPYLCKLGENLLKNIAGINYLSYGGAVSCERQKIIICPEFIDADYEMANISIINYEGNLEFIKATHRDFLGALLSLGIKREKTGDLYPSSNGCILMIDADLADYIIINAPKVKGVPLIGSKLPAGSFEPQQKETIEQIVNVSSLRLDAIVANSFGISRSKAVEEIKKRKVKANWREMQNIAKVCEVKDVISLRGKGRIVIDDIIGKTKKGRIKAKIIHFK